MDLMQNKKARLNYEFIEEYEAGIELFGHEVKALRAHHGKLDGAHIIVRGNEAYVVGMEVPPYQPKNTPKDYEPARTRKLLLTKREIALLSAYEGQKGLTIVPISLYSKGGKLKLRLAAARGKKKYDKRAALKARDSKREIERTLKNQ